jgi:hypothetical protein
LPFIEQQSAFAQLDFSKSFSSWENGGGDWASFADTTVGNNVLKEFLVPPYFCPSTPFKKFVNLPGGQIAHRNSNNSMLHSYVGISGASVNPDGTEPAILMGSRPVGTAGYGVYCGNGTFGFAGPSVPVGGIEGLRGMTDGTSNTVIFGEQTGIGTYTSSETDTQKVMISSNGYGGWVGMFYGDMNACYGVGITSYHFPLNSKKNFTWGSTGDVAGRATGGVGFNVLLSSSHPGGVQFALGDGSCRLISDTAEANLLRALCIVNDGSALTTF